MNIKAVIYARVSSREQEETGYSLPAQEKLLKDYAERQGLDVVKVFSVAESASGAKQRKVFAEMISYLSKNKVPHLLCEKVDRLSRNFKEAIVANDWVEQDASRRIHFVKQNLVIHEKAKSDEKFRWDIEVVLAKKHIANLSEEVKKGQEQKIREGWLPTKPPLGYKTIGDRGHKIHVIDQEKSQLIREMFELYSTGNHSTLSLVVEMHKRGLRNSAGKKVGKSRIYDLLSYPFYYGAIKWNDFVYGGKHEPIISKELFDKVQSILNRKFKNPHFTKHFPVFKSKIKCEECGGTITCETHKGHWYLHCNHYRTCSQKKWVRQEKVEEQLLPLFDKVTPKNPRVLEWLEKALKESHNVEVSAHTEQREEINRLIKIADQRIEKAYLDKLDGKMDAVVCEKVITDSTKEKEELLGSIKRLHQGRTAYYEAGYAIHELASNAQKIYQSPKATTEDKRLLLSHVFSGLSLQGEVIKPNYTLAFEFLTKWVPKLNKTLVPMQKTAETVVSSGLLHSSLKNTSLELSEVQNDFRTSGKPLVKPRHSDSDTASRLLLRG